MTKYTAEQLAALRRERRANPLPPSDPKAIDNSHGYKYRRYVTPTPTLAALERIQSVRITDEAWSGLRDQAEAHSYHHTPHRWASATKTTASGRPPKDKAIGVGAYLDACATLPPRQWDDTRPDDITSRYDDPDTGRICWNPSIAPLPDTDTRTSRPGRPPLANTRTALGLYRHPRRLALAPSTCDVLRAIAAFWWILPLRRADPGQPATPQNGDPLAQVIEIIGRGWLSPLRPHTVPHRPDPLSPNAERSRLGLPLRGRPRKSPKRFIVLPNY